jgi:choline kinase
MRRPKVHIIVLAAGRGSRLAELGNETPKWLLSLQDVTIARRQLDAIGLAAEVEPGSIGSVRVVTGHASQAIERFLAQEGPATIEEIYNPEYATLNNWYSLLIGLRSLDLEQNAGVVVVNADLLASAEWMAQFVIDSIRSSVDALIAVDHERQLTDEAMKVSVSRENFETKLKGIGKIGIDDPVGEYVGMLMARGAVLKQFQGTLESYLGREELGNAWYEHAVGQTADDGAGWGIWSTPDSTWIEIDDHADYVRALQLIQTRTFDLRKPA